MSLGAGRQATAAIKDAAARAGTLVTAALVIAAAALAISAVALVVALKMRHGHAS